MSKNPLLCNGEENEKLIWNSHVDLDHHQKLISSRGPPVAHACWVWLMSVFTFVSYPVYRMTEWYYKWQTERSHNLCIIGGGNNNAKYTGNQRKLWIKFVQKINFITVQWIHHIKTHGMYSSTRYSGGIGIIWLTVNKPHDVARSFMCHFDVIRLFRKYPRLFWTFHHCTADWTGLVAVLPAYRNNATAQYN